MVVTRAVEQKVWDFFISPSPFFLPPFFLPPFLFSLLLSFFFRARSVMSIFKILSTVQMHNPEGCNLKGPLCEGGR